MPAPQSGKMDRQGKKMNATKAFAALLLAATVLLAPPALAEDAAALCNELAASPDDPAIAPGEGVDFAEVDVTAALPACLRAAKADPDNATLRFQLARVYDVAANFERAIATYEQAIARGSMVASSSLAQLYEGGHGVPKDEARAAELYEPAAEAGVLSAVESLGKLYEDGRGVPQDHARAAALYEQAAELGSNWGRGALGWLLENGLGVEQDMAEAARLYAVAAEAGVDFAQNNLASFYAEGLAGLERDDKKAVELYTKAADQGLVLAKINLAIHYSYGDGVKRSVSRAENLLRAAIAEGNDDEKARARNNLAWMFATQNMRLGEAEQLARAAVDHDRSDPNRLDTLAWVLHLAGKSGEALPLIQEAMELAPDNADFQAHLEEIEAAAE